MELLGKLASNDTSNIVMLPSASKSVSVKFVEKYLHIPNNNYRLHRLKGDTKMQNRESIFKYKSCFYNVQRNNDVKHRGIKLR